MWKSKILNSSYANGVLIVNMEYSNGTTTFPEQLDMTGGSMDVLSEKVQTRLNTLEATEALNAQIATGAFTPVLPAPSPADVLRVAVQHLQNVQKASDLGLLTPVSTVPLVQKVTVEPVVTADPLAEAQAAAVAAFDPSLIDQL